MKRKNRITIAKNINIFLFLLVFSFFGYSQRTTISQMDTLIWEKVMPGIWKASFGQIGLNPMNYTNLAKVNALGNLGDSPFPINEKETFSQLTPTRSSIRLPLNVEEQIYGLGLEFEGLNRRGEVYTLKVDHYGGIKGFTHAPVPFYVSSEGYGVLINSSKRVKIYVGNGNRKDGVNPEPIDRTTGKNWDPRPISDAVEASVQGDGMEIYVFAGPTPLEVVQRYNLFFGGGIVPPKWGLGFWHRMHTESSDKDVLKEIEDFKNNRFPLDVIGLEPGWQSFAYPCSYDWDSTRFPNPEHFVKTLDKAGIKINLWENPYVAPISSMYDDIKPFTASHTVWLGEVPDYTIPKAKEVLLNHHKKNHLDLGISGYKFDEVDGYDYWLWPDHATFPSNNDAVEIRQLYGSILQNMFDAYFKENNVRTYGLIRSSYIGASSHNFVLYSDYYEHKGYVTAMSNASLSGLLWTPEVRNAKTAEEWLRRFQSVCFSPLMMLNAWSSGKKPWSFPEVTDDVRAVIELRLRLLPYLYTSFYEYSAYGLPPFRAMVLEDGFMTQKKSGGGILDDVANPYAEKQRMEVTDQYMMGPSILVAPVFAEQKQRKVILPEGNWYDFYTGELVGNGDTIVINTELSKIPLFVKDGGIIPMTMSIGTKSNTPSLEVRYYGTKNSSYVLYNDDGVSYDYTKGYYSLTELRVKINKNRKLIGTSKKLKKSDFEYDSVKWKQMTE